MKQILQTQLYGDQSLGNGNCVAAAMASILEMPLWMMPPWDQMFTHEDYGPRRRQWLKEMLGLEIITLWVEGDEMATAAGEKVSEDALPEFYIAIGRTVRKTLHAVVYSGGKLVHDPHYSGDGIVSVERIEYFRKAATPAVYAVPASATPK